MPIKAILFDHDGTLVDSEPTHFELWKQILTRYGVDLSEQHYREHYAGVPALGNAQDMVSRFSLNEAPEHLARQKAQATSEFLSRRAFSLMPGARGLIEYFHRLGMRMAIVTGSGREVVAATAQGHGLQPFLETLISSDDVQRNKPHPDGYLLALRRLDLGPDECIAVEDTEHGLAAAAAAGIPCLAIPNIMSVHHDFSLAVDTLGELSDIKCWLERTG